MAFILPYTYWKYIPILTSLEQTHHHQGHTMLWILDLRLDEALRSSPSQSFPSVRDQFRGRSSIVTAEVQAQGNWISSPSSPAIHTLLRHSSFPRTHNRSPVSSWRNSPSSFSPLPAPSLLLPLPWPVPYPTRALLLIPTLMHNFLNGTLSTALGNQAGNVWMLYLLSGRSVLLSKRANRLGCHSQLWVMLSHFLLLPWQ